MSSEKDSRGDLRRGLISNLRKHGLDLFLVAALGLTAWRLLVIADQPKVIRPAFNLSPPAARVGATAGSFNSRKRHIVLAGSPTCPICQSSIGLYRALGHFAEEQKQWDFVVINKEDESQDKRQKQWLSDAGVDVGFVNHVMVSTWATPTLMLVDSNGTITDLLVGFVNASLEARLWDRLDHVGTARPLDNSVIPRRVTLQDLKRDEVARFQLVDFRTPGPTTIARSDAFQIPLAQVSQRAQDELSPDRPVLLDCSVSGITEAECLVAAIPFRLAGFTDVAMLVPGQAGGR